jgi:hypothetical protein
VDTRHDHRSLKRCAVPWDLFFKWGQNKVHFWTAAQRLTLNPDSYAKRRAAVKAKLSADADQYWVPLVLG